jgi:hypothetical protein
MVRELRGALRAGGLAAAASVGALLVLSAIGAPPPGAADAGRDPRDGWGDLSSTDTLVQRFYDSLATVESRIPPEALDLGALADRLGNDPHRAIEFVSDSIHYDHYDGVVRGSAGALIS